MVGARGATNVGAAFRDRPDPSIAFGVPKRGGHGEPARTWQKVISCLIEGSTHRQKTFVIQPSRSQPTRRITSLTCSG